MTWKRAPLRQSSPAVLTNLTVSAKPRGHSAPAASSARRRSASTPSGPVSASLNSRFSVASRRDDGHRDPADRQHAAAAADRPDLAGEAFDDGAADLQRLARRAPAEQALEGAFELDEAFAELDGHLGRLRALGNHPQAAGRGHHVAGQRHRRPGAVASILDDHGDGDPLRSGRRARSRRTTSATARRPPPPCRSCRQSRPRGRRATMRCRRSRRAASPARCGRPPPARGSGGRGDGDRRRIEHPAAGRHLAARRHRRGDARHPERRGERLRPARTTPTAAARRGRRPCPPSTSRSRRRRRCPSACAAPTARPSCAK